MPPRSEIRRGPHRMSRSPPQYNTIPESHLWPDEGSDTDPEYVPSESETETESETESEYETESSDDELETGTSDEESD